MAKLEASISILSDKLELKVYGFNDKLPVLLSKVIEVAKSFKPSENRFKVLLLTVSQKNASLFLSSCIRQTLLGKINILCAFFVIINSYFTDEKKRGSFIAPFAVCWVYATSLKVKSSVDIDWPA